MTKAAALAGRGSRIQEFGILVMNLRAGEGINEPRAVGGFEQTVTVVCQMVRRRSKR